MRLVILSLILLIGTLIAEIIYREPYSWYFIPILGIGALLVKYESMDILISGASLGAFLRYLPFIYTGEYSKPVRDAQDLIFLSALGLSFFLVIIRKAARKIL